MFRAALFGGNPRKPRNFVTVTAMLRVQRMPGGQWMLKIHFLTELHAEYFLREVRPWLGLSVSRLLLRMSFAGEGVQDPEEEHHLLESRVGRGSSLTNSFDGFLEEMKFRWSLDIGA